MRDLDRIREVSEYRVTGPQLASLFGLVMLLVTAAFLAGYQTGLWRSPLDSELLLPTAEEDTRQAGEALADLLARREAPTVDSMASPDARPVPVEPTEAEMTLVSTAYAGGTQEVGEPAGDEAPALVVLDDTKPEAVEATPEPTPETTPDLTPEPTPEATPAPVVASTDDVLGAFSAPAGRGYTVQVAAYEDPAEALALIRELRDQGIQAFHQSAEVPGRGTWHRVRVGVHPTKAAAEAGAKRLAGKVPFSPYVTSQP